MIFSSLTFLLFLVLCLVIHSLCPGTEKKNLVLLVFSLIFYLWGGFAGLVLLVVVTGVNWFLALQVHDQKLPSPRRLLLGVAVAVDVAAFAVVRFWDYLPQTQSGALAGRYVIPMGFAFYTLQLISYVTDVYRKQIRPQRRLGTLLLYSSMFAQSAGGPIVRYGQIEKTLKARKLKSAMVSRGITRFACGLAKKVVLADSCGVVVSTLLGEDAAALSAASVLSVWLGSLMFMLQLFLELSSYADMAVGLGLMFGFRFPENFDYPYVADSLQAFWGGWYKTVVDFFRDYVYLPLGGKTYGSGIQVMNMLIVGLLFGFWSGTGANVVIWAVYCLILLMIEGKVLGRITGNLPALGHIWVLGTMFLGFVIYRYTDLGMLLMALQGLVGLNGAGFALPVSFGTFVRYLILLFICVIACTPAVRIAASYIREQSKTDPAWLKIRCWLDVVCPVALLILSVLAMVGDRIPSFSLMQF